MRKFYHPRLVVVLFAALAVFVMAGQTFSARYPDLPISVENCNVVLTYEDPGDAFTSIIVSNNGAVLASYATGTVPAWELATVVFPITQYFTGESILIALYNSEFDFNYTDSTVSVPNALVRPCLVSEGYCAYPLPVDAVQGRLEGATQAYYAPSTDAKTDIVLPVGSSWWIAGSENGFYKLFVACQADYLWVPASALGANYDNPWNGAALPSTGA